MAKSYFSFRFIKFDPLKKPWPKEIISWSHEGFQPRDMSWGFVKCGLNKIHIMAGDWVIRMFNDNYICRAKDFPEFYEKLRNNLKDGFDILLGAKHE